MRPYLLFLSGASGLAGASFMEGPLWWKGVLVSFIFFFTYGFGQALTDIFQTDTDALSSPYRPLVRGLVTRRAVGSTSVGFMLVCGIILGLMDWLALLLAVLGISGLALYTWFKRRWWGGPPWNSWIFALLAVIARVALEPASLTVILSEPRFLFALGALFFPYANFVLVGYLKDLEADRFTGYRTFPVVFGWKANAWLTDIVLLLATTCGVMFVILSQPGLLPVVFLAVAVAVGAVAQIDQHRHEDPERAWFPTLFACRANLLFALLITAANRPHALPFLAAYYGFFEFVLWQRPEPSQI
jgi:4-hydroxybenzoate polyprenyltransferase